MALVMTNRVRKVYTKTSSFLRSDLSLWCILFPFIFPQPFLIPAEECLNGLKPVHEYGRKVYIFQNIGLTGIPVLNI